MNVKLKTYADMIVEYSFDDDRIELVEQMMQMFGSASGVNLRVNFRRRRSMNL